ESDREVNRPGGTEVPETRYAKAADGLHLAYQVVGDGPVDLLFVPGGGSNVELGWDITSYARVLWRLASFSRLILFDFRGSGLSDPIGFGDEPSLEQRGAEMLAVLDAADSQRAVVMANSVGGLSAALFAATYPTRVSSLVLHGCYARMARAEDYPWGVPG